MAIIIAGMAGASYDVDAAQWPRVLGRSGGAKQHVEGAGWLVTATANAREVSIAPGYGYAMNVEAYSDSAVTLTAGANSSGSTRYDMVVFTYDWGTPANSAFSIKASTSVVTALTQTEGTTWEMPVALLSVSDGQGVFNASQITDLRPLGHGVVNIELSTDWVAWNAYRTPQCAVSGELVTLRGAVKSNIARSGKRYTFGYLPARVCPPGVFSTWIVETATWTFQGGAYYLAGLHVNGATREVQVSYTNDSAWIWFNPDALIDLGGHSYWKGY